MAVLIIEDDPDLRHGVRDLLYSEGYEVLVAENGRDGLQCLKNNPGIRLILLDYTMPQLDAKGFRKVQLAVPEIAAIPVVLITAVTLSQSTLNAINVDTILQKPVDIDDLIHTVKRMAK